MDAPITSGVRLIRTASFGLALLFLLAACAATLVQGLPGAPCGGPTGLYLLVGSP